MQEGPLLMTQAERDRLATLKKVKKKVITQRAAALLVSASSAHAE
jgi:hypothetical protein